MSALLQIEESVSSPVAVGIDLGTTHSLVAARKEGRLQCLPVDERGGRLLASVVRAAPDGTLKVGKMPDGSDLPSDAIRSAKRFMGRNLGDVSEADRAAARLAETEGEGVPRFVVGGRKLTAVEASAEILRVLARCAEKAMNRQVRDAVITVPAYFDDAQRQATRDAGRLAGLNVLRIINEPTAAAIAYGLDKKVNGHFAVYDLGGGTFDLSVLSLDDGVFQVLSTRGDTQLGGDDFDRALLALALEKALHAPASDLSEIPQGALRHWLTEARRAKEELTDETEALFDFGIQEGLPSPLAALSGAKVLAARDEFEASGAVLQLVNRTIRLTKAALKDAHLEAGDLDGIVMVGGMTRMPLVRREVAKFFGREPLVDLDPDQVVALGAAVQAEQLSGASSDEELLLLDVNPLSLGLETMGGVVEKVIPRNSTIPASVAQVFTTFKDGQTALSIHVVQGERELAKDCRSLARFELRGIPPMAAGLARVQVTFALDADGLLKVSAEELSTGIRQEVQVKPSHGLSDEDIEEMLMEAIDNAEDDVARRLVLDARIEAERIAHEARKRLDDHGFLLEAGEREKIEKALARVDEALTTDDFKKILAAKNWLTAVSNKLAERVMTYEIERAVKGKSADELVDDSEKESIGLKHLREQEARNSRGAGGA